MQIFIHLLNRKKEEEKMFWESGDCNGGEIWGHAVVVVMGGLKDQNQHEDQPTKLPFMFLSQ